MAAEAYAAQQEAYTAAMITQYQQQQAYAMFMRGMAAPAPHPKRRLQTRPGGARSASTNLNTRKQQQMPQMPLPTARSRSPNKLNAPVFVAPPASSSESFSDASAPHNSGKLIGGVRVTTSPGRQQSQGVKPVAYRPVYAIREQKPVTIDSTATGRPHSRSRSPKIDSYVRSTDYDIEFDDGWDAVIGASAHHHNALPRTVATSPSYWARQGYVPTVPMYYPQPTPAYSPSYMQTTVSSHRKQRSKSPNVQQRRNNAWFM